MREGIELKLYNKLEELLPKHKHPKWAVDELDYLIFIKHRDKFWNLNKEEQFEVRMYMEVLRQLYGRD